MWQALLTLMPDFSKEEYDEEKYPFVKAWMGKLRGEDKIMRVLEGAMSAVQGGEGEWEGFEKYLP